MRAGGVLLAAGAGSRFGAVKQLAPVGGRPLVLEALEPMLRSSLLVASVVVLGAHADAVAPALVGSGAEVVRCGAWVEGPSRSLAAGLTALPADVDWAVVCLGDELGLPAAAVERVLAAVTWAGEVRAARATWRGRPAHPVVLHRSLWPAVADVRGDEGARSLLRGPETLLVPCDDLGDPYDVDRPEDLPRER